MADNRILLTLSRNELVTIDCQKGQLWITDRGAKDHLIREGQKLTIRPRGKLLVQAIGGEALAEVTKG